MCIIVKEVCLAIVGTLLTLYVKMPFGDELEEVVDGFETKWGFAQCVGAVDGTQSLLWPQRNTQQTTTIGRGFILS